MFLELLGPWTLASNPGVEPPSSSSSSALGVGNISLLSYIVILRAHDNRIVVVLKLSSYRVHIISGVVFAEIRHAVAK